MTLLYTTDDDGRPLLLKEGKHQVMMEWEKPYMEAIIDALNPFGDVLEIGFGLGYSATRIQQKNPKSYTLIECDPIVIQNAKKWAASYPNITLIENTWQNALSSLGLFDAIFFDDYPLESENIQQKTAQASGFLKEGTQFIKDLEPLIPHLSYNDADLEQFISQLKPTQIQYTARFLDELVQNRQITPAQRKRMSAQYNLPPYLEPSPIYPSRMFDFLQQCLKCHMKKGSRFSCYLGNPTSKYEDPVFMEHIILNPNLDYREFTIPIDVPKNCNYYQASKALVMVIEQL